MSFLDDLGDAIVGKIEDFTAAVEDKLENFGDKAVGFLDSIEDYIPDTVIDKMSSAGDVIDEKLNQFTDKLEEFFNRE